MPKTPYNPLLLPFPPPHPPTQGFEVIIVDEAHHAPANSYTGILQSLDALADTSPSSSSSSEEDDEGEPQEESLLKRAGAGLVRERSGGSSRSDEEGGTAGRGGSRGSLSDPDPGGGGGGDQGERRRRGRGRPLARSSSNGTSTTTASSSSSGAEAGAALVCSASPVDVSQEVVPEVDDLLELEAPTLLGLSGGGRLLVRPGQ